MIINDQEKIYSQMIHDMADQLTTPIHGQSWVINHYFQQAKRKLTNKGVKPVMKVMISQPMNGIPDQEVRRIQNDIKKKFEKYHIEVMDSFITEEADKDLRNPGVFYLGRTLMNFLSDADAIYFVEGWEKARGCRIERRICEEYGIMILDESFFRCESTVRFKEQYGRDGVVIPKTDIPNFTPYQANWDGIEKSFGPDIFRHIPQID